MSNSYGKYGSNNINERRETLIDDFFKFCDGHPGDIVTDVYKKDLEEPMPPSPKQMGTLLARLNVIWKKFCDDARLPREFEGQFIKSVKAKWLEKGEQQRQMAVRKRKRQYPSA